MTGQLQFSGTTHSGIKLLSLTTAQRDALTPANGMIIYNSTDNQVQGYVNGAWGEIRAGVSDHGELTGLSDDDHTQYVLLAGRTSGQTIIGGTTTTADLTLQTTSGVGATGADMHFLVGNNGATEAVTILNNGNVGIGTTGPVAKLELKASAATGDLLKIRDSSGVDIITFDNNNGTTSPELYMQTSGGVKVLLNTAGNSYLTGGNVGIGTTAPTNLLSLGGNANRIFWMERGTVANTAGYTLTVQAGGATAGATDKNGGDLILKPGVSTGSAESGIQLYGCVAGASGTTDRTQTKAIQILGNKIGFYAATPVAQQTGVAVTIEAVHAALVNLGLITA